MQAGTNEAFSRILIDNALEHSGWNLLDAPQVRFEMNGTTVRANYVLGGHLRAQTTSRTRLDALFQSVLHRAFDDRL